MKVKIDLGDLEASQDTDEQPSIPGNKSSVEKKKRTNVKYGQHVPALPLINSGL